MAALSHPNLPAPPGTFATENPPPSHDRPHMDHSSADTIHGEQLKDKLSILHVLVFELRLGVEDLQFRLELNNEKIELFLQLLSSLQEAIHIDAAGMTSMHEPTDDIGGVRADERKEHGTPSHKEDDMMQSGEEHKKKRQDRETVVEPQTQDTERSNLSIDATTKVEVQWGDGTTIIEEEPWLGDLQGT
jgi:hypothetical protein